VIAAFRPDRGKQFLYRKLPEPPSWSQLSPGDPLPTAYCLLPTLNHGSPACRRRGRLRGRLRSGWGGHGRSARCPRRCRRIPWW